MHFVYTSLALIRTGPQVFAAIRDRAKSCVFSFFFTASPCAFHDSLQSSHTPRKPAGRYGLYAGVVFRTCLRQRCSLLPLSSSLVEVNELALLSGKAHSPRFCPHKARLPCRFQLANVGFGGFSKSQQVCIVYKTYQADVRVFFL